MAICSSIHSQYLGQGPVCSWSFSLGESVHSHSRVVEVNVGDAGCKRSVRRQRSAATRCAFQKSSFLNMPKTHLLSLRKTFFKTQRVVEIFWFSCDSVTWCILQHWSLRLVADLSSASHQGPVSAGSESSQFGPFVTNAALRTF